MISKSEAVQTFQHFANIATVEQLPTLPLTMNIHFPFDSNLNSESEDLYANSNDSPEQTASPPFRLISARVEFPGILSRIPNQH